MPDRSDLVELSIRVTPDKVKEAGGDLRHFLTGQGFHVEGDQQAKSRTALDFFTGRAG